MSEKLARKLIELLHHADVDLRYWDRKRSGAAEREITIKERMLIIRALRRLYPTTTLSSQTCASGSTFAVKGAQEP